MEKLTVSEVTDLLRIEGILDSLLTDFKLTGMSYCMHKFADMFVFVCDNYMLS